MVLCAKLFEDKVVFPRLQGKEEGYVLEMCWAERCCYVIPANLGCVLLGTFSFMLSLFTLAASVAYFIIDTEESEQLSVHSVHFARTFGLNLNISSVHIILAIVIIVALLWMLFSISLVIGIIKNKPSMVLCYFSYGIVVTILCQLSALLVLLQNCWVLALILFILSLVHIHALVVVHTVYELMQRGKDFRFHQHGDDEDPLAECFDVNTSRA